MGANPGFGGIRMLPDQQVDALRLQRQQEIAAQLLREGTTPIDPNRSAGMYVVPIQPAEGLAKLAAALSGGLMQSRVDEGMQGLANQNMQRMGELFSDGRATPAQYGNALAGGADTGAAPAAPGARGPLSLTGDAQRDMALYLMSPDKYTEIALGRYGATDLTKTLSALGIDPRSPLGQQIGQQWIAKQNLIPPMEASPGATLVHPITGQPLRTLPNNGVQTDWVNGRPVASPVPGYVATQAEQTRATTAAQEREKITPVTLPSGATVPMRAGDAIGGDLQPHIAAAAQQTGVDPALLTGMMMTESGGNPAAVSPAGAIGPMQLMPGTAGDLRVNPRDPAQNIAGGAAYYRQQADKYGDPTLALMAYNWGPGSVDKWLAAGADPRQVPQETRDYLYRVGINTAMARRNAAPAALGQSSAARTGAEALGKDFAQKYTASQQSAVKSADFVSKLQHIDDLLQNVETGRLTPLGTELASAAASLGYQLDKNLGNKQAADAMSREMALMLRDPAQGGGMPGAVSDSDRQFLESMIPGLRMDREGRAKVIGAYRAIADRNREVARMARDYAEAHGGTLDVGFDRELADYVEANPLFSGAKWRAAPAGSAPAAPGSAPAQKVADSAGFDDLPPPADMSGKMLKADDGTFLLSTGRAWVKLPPPQQYTGQDYPAPDGSLLVSDGRVWRRRGGR